MNEALEDQGARPEEAERLMELLPDADSDREDPVVPEGTEFAAEIDPAAAAEPECEGARCGACRVLAAQCESLSAERPCQYQGLCDEAKECPGAFLPAHYYQCDLDVAVWCQQENECALHHAVAQGLRNCNDDLCEGGGGECGFGDGGGIDGQCETPLVLSFDSAPVTLHEVPTAAFDLSGVGQCDATDWPGAGTPWLALDRDLSGSIDSGVELFGSGTRLVSGPRADNGFSALRELDDNADGRIDRVDSRFDELVLWSDHDADKVSDFSELLPVTARGVVSIDLDYAIDRRCDGRDNCEVERAGFTYLDSAGSPQRGSVVDVHLSCQPH